ncbi:MAG: cobalamin-dependent protein, partial [Pseudomonadota bacterium]
LGNRSSVQAEVDVRHFTDLLLASDAEPALAKVLALYSAGWPMQDIYLQRFSPAARLLGDRWSKDELSFVSVTLATGRIVSLMRTLRHYWPTPPDSLRTVLMGAVPGEDHTLGITMVADSLRQHGWRVEVLSGLDHDTFLERADVPCDVIALSASTRSRLGSLGGLIVALRLEHPQLPIVVGGRLSRQEHGLLDRCGADAVLDDMAEAPALFDRVALRAVSI